MASCEVGDDVLEDDPTVKRLEERVAAMFEREGKLLLTYNQNRKFPFVPILVMLQSRYIIKILGRSTVNQSVTQSVTAEKI